MVDKKFVTEEAIRVQDLIRHIESVTHGRRSLLMGQGQPPTMILATEVSATSNLLARAMATLAINTAMPPASQLDVIASITTTVRNAFFVAYEEMYNGLSDGEKTELERQQKLPNDFSFNIHMETPKQ